MLGDKQDAFGHLLYDHYQGQSGQEIVERNDGYFDVAPGSPFYFAPFEEWHLLEQEAMGAVRGRVLDVGCGAGRVALHLQEQEHEAMGIDVSPLAVRVCQLRGLREAQVCSITQVSQALGSFDTIVMLGNNLGLFATRKRARWLLERFYALTSETGRIVATTMDPYATDNPVHLAYHARNREHGRMSGQIRMRVRYKQYATPWFDYLLVSQEELEELVQGTGWHIAHCLTDSSPSYVAVLDKSEELH
jgi:SAM-dependent methyltransferase